MKRSRFTEEQIIGIVREQEAGAKTADVCRKHGISGATFYKWKGGRELDAIIDRRGKPMSVVSDNGTEFTSTAILHWTQQTELEQFLINLGHSRMS